MKKENWDLSEKEMTILGQSLRSVKMTKKKTAGPHDEYLFKGKESGFEVFVSVLKHEIQQIQVTFRKTFVEWKKNKLTWGYANTLRDSENQVLKPEPKMNFEFVEAIIAILEENDEYEILDQAAYALEEALDEV